jgi:hypothetical protein
VTAALSYSAVLDIFAQGREYHCRIGGIQGTVAMVTPDFIEKLKHVLQTSGVPQADVSYVVGSWWTQDQVPEIQNEYQYQEYLRRWHALNSAADASERPNFTRSREGMYLDSLGARLIDWEEKSAAAHANKKIEGNEDA